MGFVERVVSAATNRLKILAPAGGAPTPARFKNLVAKDRDYDRLLSQVQRLRGAEYLRDGAISPSDLTAGGLHRSSDDAKNWHVLWLDAYGNLEGCARYRAYPTLRSFCELSACGSALADDHRWGRSLRAAVCYEAAETLRSKRQFFEVSGWAIGKRARFSEAAIAVALGTYALGKVLGGGRGITTATTRNHSARMLRRLGGRTLVASGGSLPVYFEPRYGCTMEVLAFDTAQPDPQFQGLVESLVKRLPLIPVFAATPVLADAFESAVGSEALQGMAA